jgi:hypothetical protein
LLYLTLRGDFMINFNKLRPQVLFVLGATLALAMPFQNCSEMKFSQTSESGLGEPGGECPDNFQPDSNGLCVRTEDRSKVVDVTAPVRKVDLLLVIDNSGSMRIDNEQLSQKMSGFVELLNQAQIDWQACYTITGTQISANPRVTIEAGQALFWRDDATATGQSQPTNEIVLRRSNVSSTEVLDRRFRNSIGQFTGGGQGDEQGIASINAAVRRSGNSSCFRTDATLVSLIISDEDERSAGGRENVPDEETRASSRTTADYTRQYRALESVNQPQVLVDLVKLQFNENKKYIHHSLVIRPQDRDCWHVQDSTSAAFYGVVYHDLSIRTAGITGSICSNNYAVELANMARRIEESLDSVTLDCGPFGGRIVARYEPARPSQSYRIQGDKVYFEPALPEGTRVTVDYACEVL